MNRPTARLSTSTLLLWLLPLLGACKSKKGDLSVTPASIDFGEVDFQLDMPEQGYMPTTVTLRNLGVNPLTITIPDFDFTHLCLEGFVEDDLPLQLPDLYPDSYYLLNFGVCGYEPGERDTLIEDTVVLQNDGLEPRVTLDWRFTPIRDIMGDTGY